jgi:C1q domain
MNVKVVVVDLEIPPKVKKWGLRLGIPLAVILGGTAVAYAAGLVTWTSGQTLTAADLNANFSALQNQITTPNLAPRAPSAFRASMAGSLTVASATYTPVAFDTVAFDIVGEYSKTTGAFVPKAAGIYLATCSYELQGFNPAVTDSEVAIFQNGNEVANMAGNSAGSGSSYTLYTATAIIQVAANDTIQCKVYQNTGVSQTFPGLNDRNTFSAARLY